MRVFRISAGVLIFLVSFHVALISQPIDIPATFPDMKTDFMVIEKIEIRGSECDVTFSKRAGEAILSNTAEECSKLRLGQDIIRDFR